MITKERLEELIEQCATIWFYDDISGFEKINMKENDYKYEIGVADADDREHLLKTSIGKYGKYIDDWWWFSGLFETKEELDWYIEFGCIERTERLVLPTWEEIQKYERFDFKDKYNHSYTLHYISGFKNLAISGWSTEYYAPATKENYTIACRKAKELFLGEKK
jgi:hypothetical protein